MYIFNLPSIIPSTLSIITNIYISAAGIRVDTDTKRHLLSRIRVDLLPFPEGEYMIAVDLPETAKD